MELKTIGDLQNGCKFFYLGEEAIKIFPLKAANANNHEKYYQYAEWKYFHKSRAIHFKSYFSATSLA